MEYEPTMSDDNTECKVLLDHKSMNEQNQPGEDDLDLPVTIPDPSIPDDPFYSDPFFSEYNKLVQYFNELPEGMFITRLIVEYKSSEPDLETTRQLFFEAVKSHEDFPFGVQAELKRRVQTRRGEPPVNKLAHDIYIMLTVFDGADYKNMKEMISQGKSRVSVIKHSLTNDSPMLSNKCLSARPSGSVSDISLSESMLMKDSVADQSYRKPRSSNIIRSLPKTPTHNTSRLNYSTVEPPLPSGSIIVNKAEYDILKDTLAQVQADILHIKQTSVATEKYRSDQIKAIFKTVDGIKVDICECSKMISKSVSECREPFSDHRMPDLEQIQNVLSNTESRVTKLETFLDANKIFVVDGVASNLYNNGANESASTLPVQLNASIANSDGVLSEGPKVPVDRVAKKLYNGDADKCATLYTHRLETHDDQASTLHVPHNTSIACSDEVQTEGFKIPVIVTPRGDNSDSTDDDFSVYSRRKPRRFFISGFRNDVSTDVIRNIVHSHMLHVHAINITPSRRNNSFVIIKLSVMHTDNVNVLLRRDVWPHGVTCKQWLSRDMLRKNQYRNNIHTRNTVAPRFQRAQRSRAPNTNKLDNYYTN